MRNRGAPAVHGAGPDRRSVSCSVLVVAELLPAIGEKQSEQIRAHTVIRLVVFQQALEDRMGADRDMQLPSEAVGADRRGRRATKTMERPEPVLRGWEVGHFPKREILHPLPDGRSLLKKNRECPAGRQLGTAPESPPGIARVLATSWLAVSDDEDPRRSLRKGRQHEVTFQDGWFVPLVAAWLGKHCATYED